MSTVSLKHAARLGKAFLTRRVPVYAHYGITHRCDLTCKMCGIWRYGKKSEELSLKEIEVVAERMARLGVVQVSLGGGEPFVREDLPEICSIFSKAGVNTRVLTNGVNVTQERLQACIDAGVTNYSISMDSLSPERFDEICEYPGSWEAAVRNMSFLAHALKGKDGLLVMNCVVSNLNMEEIPDIIRFAKAIGFAVSLLPIELLPDAKAGVRNWEARFIRHSPEMGLVPGPQGDVIQRVDRTYNEVLQMKKDGWPVFNSAPYLRSSQEYLKTGRFPAEGCDAGRLYFSISPNGQFTICHRTTHGYRHILDDDFEEFFHSEEYEKKRMMEAGGCEGCMRACWIDTSSIFRTFEGFFGTAKQTLRPNMGEPCSLEEALNFARFDDLPEKAAAAVAK